MSSDAMQCNILNTICEILLQKNFESDQASRFNCQFPGNTGSRGTLYKLGSQQEADGELRLGKFQERLFIQGKAA